MDQIASTSHSHPRTERFLKDGLLSIVADHRGEQLGLDVRRSPQAPGTGRHPADRAARVDVVEALASG